MCLLEKLFRWIKEKQVKQIVDERFWCEVFHLFSVQLFSAQFWWKYPNVLWISMLKIATTCRIWEREGGERKRAWKADKIRYESNVPELFYRHAWESVTKWDAERERERNKKPFRHRWCHFCVGENLDQNVQIWRKNKRNSNLATKKIWKKCGAMWNKFFSNETHIKNNSGRKVTMKLKIESRLFQSSSFVRNIQQSARFLCLFLWTYPHL